MSLVFIPIEKKFPQPMAVTGLKKKKMQRQIIALHKRHVLYQGRDVFE